MQVCRETSMSYQALKFYCNEGLVPNVKRDKNNRRIFDERDVKWIKDLVCLKKCGMSIQEMKEYLELCLQGADTIPQRKKMLEKKENSIYYDTWMLLKKYRDVVWSLELSVRQVCNRFRIEYGSTVDEFLESIYCAGADIGAAR